MCCGSTNTLSLLKNFEEEKNIHIYIIQYTYIHYTVHCTVFYDYYFFLERVFGLRHLGFNSRKGTYSSWTAWTADKSSEQLEHRLKQNVVVVFEGIMADIVVADLQHYYFDLRCNIIIFFQNVSVLFSFRSWLILYNIQSNTSSFKLV